MRRQETSSKSNCNLAFICIFKLVRLWTVAKQWQRNFIIISLVGCGGGRQGMALPHNFTGIQKHNSASQVTRSDYDFLVPTDLVDHCSFSKTSAEHPSLHCPPFLGLTPPSPHLPWHSPTSTVLCWLKATTFPFCSLSLWLNSAPLCTNTHSVCVNSMMCLLKINDIDRALHSLQTTFPSIISNEFPTIHLWEVTKVAVMVPCFMGKKTETWWDLEPCSTTHS